MDARISIINLGVSDLARATEFYEKGLGLPRFFGPPEDKLVFFQMQGAWLSLTHLEKLANDAGVPIGSTGFKGVTLSQVVATPEEIDGLLDQAEQAGAVITRRPYREPWGVAAFFEDPDGYTWEYAWMEKPFPIT